jgi:hypothetical protein
LRLDGDLFESQENHLEAESIVAALEAIIYRNNSVVVYFCGNSF